MSGQEVQVKYPESEPKIKTTVLSRRPGPGRPARPDRTGWEAMTENRFHVCAAPDARGVLANHADLVNRASASGPAQAREVLHRLQRQSGNRHVQRALAIARQGGEAAEVSEDVERTIDRKRGGGQALDQTVRGQMESAFRADLGGVRLHTDEEADDLNRQLNAKAFTTGRDIFFRAGQYNPGASSGRELLAHELTHVMQQTGGLHTKMTLGRPGDEHEREADEVARRIVERERHPSGQPVRTQGLYRQDEGQTEEGIQTRLQNEEQEEEG